MLRESGILWCHIGWRRSHLSHPKWTSVGSSARGEAGLGGREEEARKEDFCVTCFLIAQSSSHSACRDTCIHTTAGVGASVAASPRSEPHFVPQLGFACSLVAPVNSAVAMKDERGGKMVSPPLPSVEEECASIQRACVCVCLWDGNKWKNAINLPGHLGRDGSTLRFFTNIN